jgi:hypothetical protein
MLHGPIREVTWVSSVKEKTLCDELVLYLLSIIGNILENHHCKGRGRL